MSEEHIRELELIVSAYLDLAENRAKRQILMKMGDWIEFLNQFLELSSYPILTDNGKVTKLMAELRAAEEYEKFRIMQDKQYISDFDTIATKVLNKKSKVKNIPYSKFDLIPETQTDGFIYGSITDFLDNPKHGCISGDGFVQAPDGTRAGLIWKVSTKKRIKTITPSDKEMWGVYEINFPKPIKTIDDLIYNFREVLPLLKGKLQRTIS